MRLNWARNSHIYLGDIHLKAKARIWPALSCMCHVHWTADNSTGKLSRPPTLTSRPNQWLSDLRFTLPDPPKVVAIKVNHRSENHRSGLHQHALNNFLEMRSGSEEGSYRRLIFHRLVYHSTLGSRVLKKKEALTGMPSRRPAPPAASSDSTKASSDSVCTTAFT